MSDMIPFTYGDQPVRVVSIDDEPWFVLADLCKVLEISDVSIVRRRLDDGVCLTHPIADRLGRAQQATIVSEPGMYEVVIRSDKPEAAAFRRWITAEVLPTIRRHGGYLTPAATEAALTDPDFIIRLATSLKDERARRVELEAQAEVDAPKVAYVDTYVADSDLLTLRTLAANLDVGESWLRGLLIQKKWIYSESATRWSNQKQAKETVHRYSAYSHKRAYFAPRPVHDAPRFKGEVMHTLKVTPAGAVAIAKLVRLAQAPLSVVGADEVMTV